MRDRLRTEGVELVTRCAIMGPVSSPGPAASGRDGSSSLDESALLAAVASGDEVAFAALYDRLAGLIHGLVVRVVRDQDLAQEVTQEVFVELWRTSPRYDPTRGSVRAWAATVARRRAVDRVRSEAARRAREEREARTAGVDFDHVIEEVTDEFDRRRVATVLGDLTELQREAVILAYYGGHTYGAVARLLDIPVGTAKTRIRDGLAVLRRRFGEDR